MKTFAVYIMLLAWTCSWTQAQDWRAIRGSDGSGAINPGEVLSQSQAFQLKVAWKKKIGSGYSSVVVAQEKLLVMFTDADKDVIACMGATNGSVIWKKPIGPKFVGKNGSFDGPLATPLIDGDQVYVISALGKMICFQLSDGTEVWSRDLQEQDKAPLPLYGFTTSPIVFEDNLIVQTGTKGKSLAAFNKRTGEPIWSCSDDSINSQNPVITTIGNQPVLLAAGGKKLTGVNPDDGQILFEYEHGGENGSAMMPVVYDGNKVLLTLDDRFSKAVSLRPVEDSINVSEEWQQTSIKNTYNVPAIDGPNAYAYSTRILTSVETATGKPNWKSRKPGDGFLILVDGHLVISTKKGEIVVAKANPDQYQPLAELKVFEDLVWSIPAYSGNAIYQRSLGEVARIDITPVADSRVAESGETMPIGKQFSKFVDAVAAANGDSQSQMINDYLKTNSVPVIEGNLVHFVYRGPGTDVAVACDVFGARQERKMVRAGNSDLFYYATELPTDQRANYVFVVDYQMTQDANNSQRRTTSSVYAGEMEFSMRLPGEELLKMNWFAMSDWKPPKYLKAIGSEAPKLTKVDIKEQPSTEPQDEDSGESENSRPRPPLGYQVLLPPGYEADSEKKYHTVYVLPGSSALKFGAMALLVNDLFANSGRPGYETIDPCIVIFTDNAGPELTDKIVPSVDSKFRTIASRDGRSLIGNAFMAGAAFSMGLKSDAFSGIASQSPLMFDAAKENLIAQLKELDKPFRVYLEWGNFDMFNPDENWDMRKDGREVFEMLRSHKQIELAGGEMHDSTDWSSWRNRYDKLLKHITGG